MRSYIVILILLSGVFLQAKSATIQGLVSDANTKESLIGSSIYIEELKTGITSGLDGTYLLQHIPSGSYTLTCKLLGYHSFKKSISITDNEVLVLDISLSPRNNELKEIGISAHYVKSTDLSARNLERSSDRELNVVSAKSIELSPDLNVANIIQRVSGVSIEQNSSNGGQYAILRGMDKRFNYTLVNGVKIPGTHNKHRYLPLDIFPSFLIERLEVSKTLTANLEADAIGGAVNMVMKEAPEKLLLSFNLTTGYNRLFLESDFYSFDTKAIREQSPYETNSSNTVSTPNDFSKKNLDLHRSAPVPNISGDFALGNRFAKNRLGILLAGSFNYSTKGSKALIYETENDTANRPLVQTKSDRKTSEQIQQLCLHSKLDYLFNMRNKLSLFTTFLDMNNAQTRETEKINYENSSTSLSSYSLRYKLNHQQLINSVLQGEHDWSENFKMNWSAVFGIAQNKTPDEVNLSLFNEIVKGVKQPLTVSNGGSTRRWQHNTDENEALYLNFIYSPSIAGLPVEIATGGLYRNKDRTSFFNEYRFFAVLNSDFKSVQGRDWNSFSEIQWKNTVDLNNTDPLNFSAHEQIGAGYAQLKLEAKKLQIIAGLRLENTDQGYTLKYTKGDVSPMGKQTYTDFLPNVHLKYKASDKNNVRLSYFRSINRPGFLEIVPYIVVDDEYTEMGNPNLKHTVADNIDLRYELFPKPLDELMIGAFYKNIQDPIEYGWSKPQGSKGNIYYSPDNFGNARNYGFEVDWIKFYRCFGIKANYTYTHSSITTNKQFKTYGAQGWEIGNTTQTRPLFGQSAHVANLSLLYKDNISGWDAQLSFNYTGERIYLVSRFVDDDQWQKAALQLDASVEKKLRKGISIFAKAKNLLNTPMEVYIKKGNPANSSIPDQGVASNSTLIRKEFSMQSFLIGIRCKF